ncbi:MAG: hypothetical protein M0O99_03410 [Desulfuromonas thiophila]|jgi:hypothetical protein|nr:hypothetical protein [Desulfuromonas thiophila]
MTNSSATGTAKGICRFMSQQTTLAVVGALVVLLGVGLWPQNSWAASTGQDGRKPFIVVQVQNRTGQPGWENHLIAYGIRNIVNDEFYRSGRYVPIEDDPEMLRQIDRFIAATWQNDNVPEDIQEPAVASDTQVRVFIDRFKTSRTRSIGLLAAAKTTLQVGVRIELSEVGQPLRVFEGSGKGVTKSLGVLFEIRQDRVHFNETTVGQATQKAIEDALANL